MSNDPYEPVFEGWKEPVEDNDRPWRLVIEPRRLDSKEAARRELEELFRNAPGAYPGSEPRDDE